MKHKTPKCHQCGAELASRTAPPHRRKLRYEGVAHDVLVEDLPEWHCTACGISGTDEESDPFLQAALRKHTGLLANGSPENPFGENVVHGPVDSPAIRGGQKGRETRRLRSAGG